MRAVLEVLLFPVNSQDPPLSVTAALLFAAVRAERNLRQAASQPTRGSVGFRVRWARLIGLLLAGPLVICAAQLANFYAVWPIVKSALWHPIKAGMGWPERMANYSFPLADLAAGTIAGVAVVTLAGWIAGRMWSVAPFDGLWLTNPASVWIGHLLCRRLFSVAGYAFERWSPLELGLQLIALCPIYAWVFFLAAGGESQSAAAERAVATAKAG